MSIEIAVFGGGAGGVGAALELAMLHKDWNIYLFESKSDLLLGSSNATPGRAGHGYHYIHAETGKMYLEATINVVRRYPDCLLGDGLPESHYLRHGLYFIMKQKQDLKEEDVEFACIFPKKDILETYQELKEYYRKLVTKDSKNKVFGEPDDFFIIDDLNKYSHIVDCSKTDTVINTREELINWSKLRSILTKGIEQYPNIRVYCNTKIKNPRYSLDGRGFLFDANGKSVYADYVINSTWEQLEYLNNQLECSNDQMECSKVFRTNRLKAIATVQLPDSLTKAPSMFFCMGPHAMFSNMGNGTGMITYAPETNVKSSTALIPEEDIQQYLNQPRSERVKLQGKELGDKIVKGISKYINLMELATLIDIKFGIIKTLGKVDIYDPNSQFHRRDDYGVSEERMGWINNSCMKLLYFLENAKKVNKLLSEHIKVKKNKELMISQLRRIFDYNKFFLPSDIKKFATSQSSSQLTLK